MSKWFESLYLRLVLTLLIALGASFGTMFLLFQHYLQGNGIKSLSSNISSHVLLLEELLQTHQPHTLPLPRGMQLASQPSISEPETSLTDKHYQRIRQLVEDSLHHTTQLIPSNSPRTGVWVELHVQSREPLWLFFPTPTFHNQRDDMLALGILVGFLVFFAGGCLLLWQVQRPLKRLSEALDRVGQNLDSKLMLAEDGSGITRTLTLRYNQMVKRLLQTEEDRSVMLAGIAHDLRTPITRLQLITELAQTDRRADFILNLNQIEGIVEQFLSYARGSNEEAFEARDLPCFVTDVLAAYADREITIDDRLGECEIVMRPNSLRRVIVNLLENSLEYANTPIVIEIDRIGDEAIIAVCDTGNGIPEDSLERVMRPFSRLDDSRGGHGHCGLGLGIVQKIVAEHGGTIRLYNRPERGLRAEIRLPIEPPAGPT